MLQRVHFIPKFFESKPIVMVSGCIKTFSVQILQEHFVSKIFINICGVGVSDFPLAKRGVLV